MTGTWRVDRPSNPGNETEWFGTDKTAAQNRAAELSQRGVQHCVAWEDMADYAPLETNPTPAAWASERPVPLIDRIRGLAGKTLCATSSAPGLNTKDAAQGPQEPISAPPTPEVDPSYTDVTNGVNGTIQKEAS